MDYLELWQEPGVYPRVTTGMALQNSSSSVTSGLLSSCRGYLGTILEAWQGNRNASRGEAGEPGSHSSCHRHIGVPINFQEELGIGSF